MKLIALQLNHLIYFYNLNERVANALIYDLIIFFHLSIYKYLCLVFFNAILCIFLTIIVLDFIY